MSYRIRKEGLEVECDTAQELATLLATELPTTQPTAQHEPIHYDKELERRELERRQKIAERIRKAWQTRRANKQRKHKRWTTQEKDLVTDLHNQGIKIGSIAKQLGRTRNAIKAFLHTVDIASTETRKHKPWTSQEKQQLASLRTQGYTFKEIAKQLGRTTDAVKTQYKDLKAQQPTIIAKPSNYRYLTSNERETIIREYFNNGNTMLRIAKLLNRSKSTIWNVIDTERRRKARLKDNDLVQVSPETKMPKKFGYMR
jgi:DNA-binding NarL/FixJ family response regulator